MYKNFALICFVLIFIFNRTWKGHASGGEIIQGESRASLISKSALTLVGTTVNGLTNVEGSLTATRVTLKDILVKGRAHFKESALNGMTTVAGFFKFDKGKCQGFEVKGGSELMNAEVFGDASVDGVLVADHVLFHKDVTINGSAKFAQSRLQGRVVTDGSLYAEQTTFEQPCEVATDRALFVECRLAKITVKSIENRSTPQQIVLVRDTQVTGDIVFEREGGIVIIGAGSLVQGKIINGQQSTGVGN